MEILLLIALFIYLVVTNNSLSSKLKNMEEQLNALNRKLNKLKSTVANDSKSPDWVAKPDKKEEKKNIPVIEIGEEFKPVIEIPVTKPIDEEKEKIVYSMSEPEQRHHQPQQYIPQKSWWENFKEKNPDLEKFIGENLINKIGVLILVLGISYFVKYSIDKGWISEPARVGLGILSGALVLGIAHRLRDKFAAFSSVFVAGAIAIFYFTIGIAFHDYKLFGQTTAFIIMVLITGFSCFISLSYNRKELAILSLIGGFAVPFMVSTGEGNYIVLFTYILILDLGILAIAYFKKWNVLNILAFVFTILLYCSWMITDVFGPKPHYLGALLFGFAFYLVFIAMNIINNVRNKGSFTIIELSILVSNTFVFYAAGMVILSNYHPEFKGLFTTVLGVLNFGYAAILYKKFHLDKTAAYLLIGLTLTFITLAIPVQFEGNYITLFWSAEAVLLFWLAQKSNLNSYKFASVVVTCLMLISLLLDWKNSYMYGQNYMIIFNKFFITGIVSVLSLVGIRHLLKNETENSVLWGVTFNPITYNQLITILAIVVGYFVGLLEVSFQSSANLYGNDSPFGLTILYHLVFCSVLFYFLVKSNKVINHKIAVIIGLFNIFLFTFWFSNTPFNENYEYLNSVVRFRVSFWLHYLSLAIVIYFGYQIYKLNKENVIFEFFKHRLMLWIVAFFIIYLASTELMLHSEVISLSPITQNEVMSSRWYQDNKDMTYAKELLSYKNTDTVRNLVVRTGYPILWGIIAFAFLIYGIKKQNKKVRIIALTVLGLTIVKLFLYDIRNASETGKIIAFILLGILILIISFVYQKIKVLVLDDAKPVENEEKNDTI
ncbi:MAG: DUF2339 domain-containing protein [Flavobacterium sp.]|nr:DUF2339 domain-containing protein [Flavobacterium sp.]